MRHRIFALCTLLVLTVAFVGCDADPKKVSNEPVVQDLEIETGEAFNPSEKKDK
jgi:predicted component of type VI protein secretion system